MIIARQLFAAGFAAVVLVTGACSSGGGSKASPTPVAESPAVPGPTVSGATSGACPSNSGLSGNVSDHGAAAATGSTLDIEAGDFFFAPTCETSVKPGTVKLVVKNTGQALHNVMIADQDIDVDVAPGETITIDVNVSSDAVPFVCKYHRTSGMVGSLIPAGG